jgi:hypothetical protein
MNECNPSEANLDQYWQTVSHILLSNTPIAANKGEK